jgi:putative aminopeptidase FrvX
VEGKVGAAVAGVDEVGLLVEELDDGGEVAFAYELSERLGFF